MCGVAGIVGVRQFSSLNAMVDAIVHRGPDGRNTWSSGTIHLAATRLAIMDPTAPTQPMLSQDGRCALAFNGEIYNHRDLRVEMRLGGYRFETGTDTEVVLAMCLEHGIAAFERLQGMFALAFYDGQHVHLARDRMGIKPLFYGTNDGALCFASEIRALLVAGIEPKMDPAAIADQQYLSYVPTPRTLFEGIRCLAPGHRMAIGPDGTADEPVPFRDRLKRRTPCTLEDSEARFAEALEASVADHMVADVPVGVTLSGGIDSAILALLAAEISEHQVKTFTIADHADHPDMRLARQIAEIAGNDHHEYLISFEEFLAAIPAVLAAEARPSSLFGLPLFVLSNLMSRQIKCALHGEGADELLGGYPEYLDSLKRRRYFAERLTTLQSIGLMPSEDALALIRAQTSAATFEDYLDRIFRINLEDPLRWHHLDLVDRYSMACGVEMRVPYLSDDLVDFSLNCPTEHLVSRELGVRKYLLRRYAMRRFGMPVLDVVLREKLGAPSAAIRHHERLRQLCEATLPDSYLATHPMRAILPSKQRLIILDLFMEIFVTHRGDIRNAPDFSTFLAQKASKPFGRDYYREHGFEMAG